MQFNIIRMLLAVTAFGVAFGAFSHFGTAGVSVSAIVGLSTGLICLMVRPIQAWRTIRMMLLTVLGGFLGLLLGFVTHPTYNSGGVNWYVAVGGVAGFVAGGLWMNYQAKLETFAKRNRDA